MKIAVLMIGLIALCALTGCMEVEGEFDGDVRMYESWNLSDDSQGGSLTGLSIEMICIDIDWTSEDCGDVTLTYSMEDASGTLIATTVKTFRFVYDDQYSFEEIEGRQYDCEESTCLFRSPDGFVIEIPDGADRETLVARLELSKVGDPESLEITTSPPAL